MIFKKLHIFYVYNLICLDISALLNLYFIHMDMSVRKNSHLDSFPSDTPWCFSRRNEFVPVESVVMGQFLCYRNGIHLELSGRLIWTQFKNYESLLVTIVFSFKELSRLIIDTMLCFCVCEYVCVSVCVCVKFTCWFILLLNFCIEKLICFNWQNSKNVSR